MAAYDKQQPQPPLNAAYYGPPIPPQPPHPAYYYAPPLAPRRSGPRCLFCCLFKVIAVATAVLGAAVIVLWLIFRPSAVKAYADSAALSRFDLDARPGGGGGSLLQYSLTVEIRVRNRNRFGINYERAEAQASYDGERFGYDAVEPFYLARKSDGKITATFNGSSVIDDDDAERTYRREKNAGFYFVKVKVNAGLGFKVTFFTLHDYKSKITCTLKLPVVSAGNTPTMMTRPGSRCAVDF